MFAATVLTSQTIVNVGIGPTWPKTLRGTEKQIAWNGTVEFGRLFDNIVGVGIDLDFSWNVNDSLVDLNDTTTILVSKNKTFMFPVSGMLFFDPIPKFKLHPVIKGQFGLGMMVRDIEQLDSVTVESQRDGFYIGYIGKGSVDAVLDLGDHAAIFVGFEYQAGRLRHKIKKNSNLYTYYSPNSPAIRMGMSILF